MKKMKRILILLLILTAAVLAWKTARSHAEVPVLPPVVFSDPGEYAEQDVLEAVCVSYFTYGCEGCDALSGSVAEILDSHEMGILRENFGVVRSQKDDPSTAAFDTASFIRSAVGHFRFLCDSRDEKSSFYGAAFCDDAAQRVWVSYSGSVSLADTWACLGLACKPGLTSQEREAFTFFGEVLQTPEVRERGYTVLLTGHSLGGALATMVSCASGYPALTVNGADRLGADKIHSILGMEPGISRITNFVTKSRRSLAPMEIIQSLMFLGRGEGITYEVMEPNGLTTDTHCAFSFLNLGQ